jgi:hypothetical protein
MTDLTGIPRAMPLRTAVGRFLGMILPLGLCALLAGCDSVAGLAQEVWSGNRPVVTTPGASPADAVSEQEAIDIAARVLPRQAAFQSATHGPFVAMYDQLGRPAPRRPADVEADPQREVWAVTFAYEFDSICRPDGSGCESPRPGINTVMIDYFTGEVIASFGYAPNPN